MKFLVDGIEMNIYSLNASKRGCRYWVGIWREDGIVHTKYFGIDDGLPEHDPRLQYRRLTKEPLARRGTLWTIYQGQRVTLYYGPHSVKRKNGGMHGPYWYWWGFWSDESKNRHGKCFGRTLPAECELIEGDAPDTETGYEEAPIDGYLAFLLESETI